MAVLLDRKLLFKANEIEKHLYIRYITNVFSSTVGTHLWYRLPGCTGVSLYNHGTQRQWWWNTVSLLYPESPALGEAAAIRGILRQPWGKELRSQPTGTENRGPLTNTWSGRALRWASGWPQRWLTMGPELQPPGWVLPDAPPTETVI